MFARQLTNPIAGNSDNPILKQLQNRKLCAIAVTQKKRMRSSGNDSDMITVFQAMQDSCVRVAGHDDFLFRQGYKKVSNI